MVQPKSEESKLKEPKLEEIKLETPKTEEAKKKHTRTSRGRSKRGCFECRERHLKCDEKLPVCDRCRTNERACTRPVGNKLKTIIAPSTKSNLSPTTPTTATSTSSTSILPISLGSPTNDPNGVFEWIGSPHIPNMDSLVFWLTVKTSSQPEGFAGSLTPSWVTLIQQHRDADPAVLSMFAVNALMVQGDLTRTDSSKHLARAVHFMLQEARRYKVVSSVLLMVILYLGSAAGNEGDIKAAETHFKAVKSLYNKDVKISELEWIFLWGTDITIATMLRRRPLLPWYIPPAFKDPPILLSMEEMSKLHRLAANNSASVLKLVEIDDDFLLVSGILRDLHLIYRLRHSKTLSDTDPSIHAYTIGLSWKTNSFFLESKSRAEKTQDSADMCKQLLALALQSSTWHFTMPYVSQDDLYVGEPETFPSVPTVLKDCTHEILEDIGGAKSAFDAWATMAAPESFVWISYTMALNFGANDTDAASPWISALYSAASLSGVSSRDALRDLLIRWPCDVKQVDTVVEGFEPHLLSPSSSTLIMSIR